MRTLELPRDERGWRVPRPGTLSRRVYELAATGKRAAEIHHVLGGSLGSIHVLLWKIKNPETSNARNLADYHGRSAN